jgi:hypothetical protein
MAIFTHKIIYRLIMGILLFIPILIYSQNVKSILDTIPLRDREALTQLFYWMMCNENLNYTLFGDKPVSLSGDFIISPFENRKNNYQSSFEKCWIIWEKYKKKFPIHQNYILIKEPSITVCYATNIIFINKKEFIKEVNQNIDVFKKKLGSYVTAETLLKEIEDKKRFAPIIKNDEVLWGILLGYGAHNAKLYAKKYCLERFIYFDEFPMFPIKKPSPSKNFSSIEEELDFLESKLRPFGEHGYSPIIQNSVHFMADSEHPETKALEKKYKKLRGEISAIYAQGDFLEITLSKLTSVD